MNKCKNCGEQFASRQSLWNHKQRCGRYDPSKTHETVKEITVGEKRKADGMYAPIFNKQSPLTTSASRTKADIIGYSDDQASKKLRSPNTRLDAMIDRIVNRPQLASVAAHAISKNPVIHDNSYSTTTKGKGLFLRPGRGLDDDAENGSSIPKNEVIHFDKIPPVDPVLTKSFKSPDIKNMKKVKQSSINDKVNDSKDKNIANNISSNNDNNEEAEILKVIENLDELYESKLKKLVKNYLVSDVVNDELMLPKILDIIDDLPDLEKLELEYLLNQIDQNRLDGIIKSVLAYLTKYDRQELLDLMKEFRNDGIDVTELDESLKMFFESERDDDGNPLLSKILHMVKNLPVSKVKQIRFEILLKNIDENRYRVENILTRLNRALNEEQFLDSLKALSRESLLSRDQYDQLKSSGHSIGISNIANIIKSTKIGRGLRFLPRLSKDLKQTLNIIADESNNSSCFILKKELLAITEELLYRKSISKEGFDAIKQEIEG